MMVQLFLNPNRGEYKCIILNKKKHDEVMLCAFSDTNKYLT